MALARIQLAQWSGSPTVPNTPLPATVRVLAGLGADAPTLPADGVTAVTLHYAGPDAAHAWTINGVAGPAVTPAHVSAAEGDPALYESSLAVTAAQAGPVLVAVNGATLTLTAV